MRSASAITNTRTRASKGRSAAWRTTSSRTSATRISCAPRGSTQAMSGCTPDSTRRRVSSGSVGIAGDQRRRELPRRRALAAAGRPMEEVGVRQRGGVAQARLERDAQRGAGPRWRPGPSCHTCSNARHDIRCAPPPPGELPSIRTYRPEVPLGELVICRRNRALKLFALALEPVQLSARERPA